MHWLQKVVNSLHRIEGLYWHFDEDGDPVGHGTVPETGQLQGFQFTAVLRLVGDEACVGIDIIG